MAFILEFRDVSRKRSISLWSISIAGCCESKEELKHHFIIISVMSFAVGIFNGAVFNLWNLLLNGYISPFHFPLNNSRPRKRAFKATYDSLFVNIMPNCHGNFLEKPQIDDKEQETDIFVAVALLTLAFLWVALKGHSGMWTMCG